MNESGIHLYLKLSLKSSLLRSGIAVCLIPPLYTKYERKDAKIYSINTQEKVNQPPHFESAVEMSLDHRGHLWRSVTLITKRLEPHFPRFLVCEQTFSMLLCSH